MNLAKRDFFSSLLENYLKGKVTYKKPDGGLAFWLKPTGNIDFQVKGKSQYGAGQLLYAGQVQL